jgi:hypothetical protein
MEHMLCHYHLGGVQFSNFYNGSFGNNITIPATTCRPLLQDVLDHLPVPSQCSSVSAATAAGTVPLRTFVVDSRYAGGWQRQCANDPVVQHMPEPGHLAEIQTFRQQYVRSCGFSPRLQETHYIMLQSLGTVLLDFCRQVVLVVLGSPVKWAACSWTGCVGREKE